MWFDDVVKLRDMVYCHTLLSYSDKPGLEINRSMAISAYLWKKYTTD